MCNVKYKLQIQPHLVIVYQFPCYFMMIITMFLKKFQCYNKGLIDLIQKKKKKIFMCFDGKLEVRHKWLKEDW